MLDHVYKSVACEGKFNINFNHSNIVVSSGDFEWWDIQSMLKFYQLINDAPKKLFKQKTHAQIENLLDRFYNVSKTKIYEQKNLHEPLMKQYNVKIMGHYDITSKTIYNSW